MIKQPILWTENPNRIKALFIKVENGNILISCPTGSIVGKLFPDENVELLKDAIAKALAGKPVGRTLQILESMKPMVYRPDPEKEIAV